jgi:hypothetical protein
MKKKGKRKFGPVGESLGRNRFGPPKEFEFKSKDLNISKLNFELDSK